MGRGLLGNMRSRIIRPPRPGKGDHGEGIRIPAARPERVRAPAGQPDEMELVTRLIENAGDFVFVSQDWRIVHVNSRCAQKLGRPRPEIIGDLFLDLAHPEDRPALIERYSRIINGQTPPSGIVIRDIHRDGSPGWLGIREIPFPWNGRPAVIHLANDITDRVSAEEGLRHSEERYRLLVETASEAIAVLQDGVVKYVSPRIEQVTGYGVSEVVSRELTDFIDPDQHPTMNERMASLLSRQVPSVTDQFRFTDKNGGLRWGRVTAVMIDWEGRPAILALVADVTQWKESEQALKASEERFRALLENSRDAVTVVDQDLNIIYESPSLAAVTGHAAEDWTGRTLADIKVHPDDRSAVRAGIQTTIYVRDIADRRKIDEMKDEFIGLVSHELRSPLTVIIGALNTAISEGPRLSPLETRQLLQDAALEAEQLSHLVGNLLELSRARANRLFLHVEPVNLARTVNKVVRIIQHQSPGHRFVVDLPARMPAVSADQLRLERVLHNLLENSVKYAPKGTDITLSARPEGGRLVVSISDQGPGISREDQARLFQPFEQLGHPPGDHTEGAGLGLLVCRRLVEAHGGRIWVESRPGHGATFRFTIESGLATHPAPERAR